MWPGLHVPSLTQSNGAHETAPPGATKPSFDTWKEPGAENLETLLRVSAGGTRDFILPASYLDELPPNAPKSAIREILQKHAIASIPGSGLNYIERCGGVKKLPVCMSGEAGLEAVAKRCRETGLRPELLVSKEGYQFCDSKEKDDTFVPGQSMSLIEQGKKVPYLKPRTRLSAEDRSKLRLPGPARRSKAVDLGSFEPQAAKVVLIDDEAAAKSRSEHAVSNLLKQIDFIVGESFGFFSAVEETESEVSSLRSSLEVLHLLPSPEPPELSLLHEELAASAACVAQEFPSGTVPPERRASVSEDTGTIRAKAVRIRGSPDSAYPFMKGGAAAALPDLGPERQEMLDPSGIEE